MYPLIIWSAAPTTRKSTGRRAAQCAAPTAQPAQTGRVLDPPLRNPLRRSGLAVGAGPRPARGLGDREGRPYGKTETGSVLRRGGPWASRQGFPPRLPPLRGKLSAARLTDEGAYRISVFFFMDSPSSASHSLGTFPLGGGRLYGRLIAAPTAETHRERWFGRARRRSWTANVLNFAG